MVLYQKEKEKEKKKRKKKLQKNCSTTITGLTQRNSTANQR
jgi:hypothetical protein